MAKTFIIGLPRTGTTSLCASFLELGYKTAHTAYTEQSLLSAEVIADTPAYCDFKALDDHFPNSQFIYLERDTELWLPSIKSLLNRMIKNINNDSGGFNPILKRCFKTIFAPFDAEHINSEEHLLQCYQHHQQVVFEHFRNRPKDLLSIDISQPESLAALLNFLDKPKNSLKHFPHLNKNQKIIAWNHISHPLKIGSNLAGPRGRKFIEYKT